MKKIFKILLLLFTVSFFNACEKDLDLKPLDKLTEATFLTKAEDYKLFATQFYESLPGQRTLFDRDMITDLMAGWTQNDISNGSYSASPSSSLWKNSYSTIRNTSYLIDKAENAEEDLTTKISKYKGEAQFFRAFAYFNLLRDFGGVPIIDKPLNVSDEEQLYGSRASREQVVDFILADLNDAITVLPTTSNISGGDIGRISKEAALAFKARVTLFEGTWRKFRNQDGNGLLSQAVSAAEQVLNSSDFELFDKRDVLGDESYKYFFILDKVQANKGNLTKGANKEYILAKKYDRDIRPSGWLGANRDPSPTRKFADLFLCTDGLPIDKSTLFEGRSTVSSEYANRDLRMKNILIAPYEKWWASTPPEFIRNWNDPDGGGVTYDISFSNHTTTGYLTRKFFTEIAAPYGVDVPVIRLAEVMLIYAEALYEKDGQISDDDLDKSINKLKARTDLPALTNAFVSSNGLDMRTEIRRERTIELFIEGHRFDDLRRWKVAEVEMPMSLTGVQFTGTQYENEEPWSSIDFELDPEGNIIVEAASNRRFEEKHYLFPLPTRQLIINPQLEQNPGW